MSNLKKYLLPAVLLLSLNTLAPVYAEAAIEPSVIRVTGYAEQEVAPDTAFVTLGLETVNAKASEAQSLNAASMNKLVRSLTELGISSMDMQSVGFSVKPRYDQSNKKIVQYVVNNSLKVRVRSLKQLPEVLEKARECGSNNIRNLQFTCADTAELKANLLKEAVTNGRRAAEAAALASGSRLGKAKEININGRAPVFKNVNMLAMRASANEDAVEAPQLQAGVQTVSESVDMVFYLE